jgi:two-component system, NtrC family, sensor histidine kinase KinB
MPSSESYPFEALYHLSSALHQHNLDTHDIMQTILSSAGDITGVTQGCLITFHEDDSIRNAYVLDTEDAPENTSELWETLIEQGLIGFVYHAQRIVTISNITTDPRWPQLPNNPVMPQQGSAIGLPLYNGGDVFGVMLFMHKELDFFGDERIAVLEEIARLSGPALNNAMSYESEKSGDATYVERFNESIVPALLTNISGQIIGVNSQAMEMLGYEDSDSIVQYPITTVNSIDTSPLGDDGLHGLVPNKLSFFRTVALDADGKEIPVIVRLRRLQQETQDVVEWVEQDITPQLEQEQLRRDLSAMIYHDLRGPLTTISGSIQKLAQVLAKHKNPAVLTFLQIGIHSTRQLRRMIDSLLDVQRLEEGNTIIKRSPIELRVILADAVQLMHPLASDAKQRLEFDWEQGLPMVNMDSDMILRVITNLMENAIKHTPDRGIVKLGARRAGDDKVSIEIVDSGQGIPKEMQSIIFDKFSRIKNKNAPSGVGLGLAFCRLAVDAHGGDIWVESELGNGSSFIFTLPIGEATPDDSVKEMITTA